MIACSFRASQPDIGLTFGGRHVNTSLAGRQPVTAAGCEPGRSRRPPRPRLSYARFFQASTRSAVRARSRPAGLRGRTVFGRTIAVRRMFLYLCASRYPHSTAAAHFAVRLEWLMEKRLSFVLASFLALAGTVSPFMRKPPAAPCPGPSRTEPAAPAGRHGRHREQRHVPYAHRHHRPRRTLRRGRSPAGSVHREGDDRGLHCPAQRHHDERRARAVTDLQMNLGKLSDEVTVVAEAKTVDTRTASTGG